MKRRRIREEAEARIDRLLGPDVEIDGAEVRRLAHELSVHQIELEMQNQQLREAQQALELAHARYFDLYNRAPIAYVTVDASGSIVDCNQTALELMTGPTPSTRSGARVQGRRFVEFVHPQKGQPHFIRRWQQLIGTGETQQFEVAMSRADGTMFWGELVINQADPAAGSEPFTRIAITDISRRKQMEGDVAHLAAIVLSSDHAIISQVLSGEILSWNAGAERLFGYHAGEVVGSQLRVLDPPERAFAEADVRKRVRSGETVAQETIKVRRDGASIPVFVSSAPILDEYGRIAAISHIARDISDEVAARDRVTRLLEQLQEDEQELKDGDRRKDEFIATLAHELRNPLAPIRNAAAVLRFAKGADSKVDWCRDVIDRQVGHMAALLDDLLDVSRMIRGMITLHRDRLELSAAVAQAIETARPLIDARNHTLTVELPSEPVEVEGDLTRLTQVFANLLNNAAKYTDPGGRITMTVVPEGSIVEIRVKDNGIGIDSEQLGGVFELFSQGNLPIGRAEGGLGIGLSLVKGLVEKHGGSIEALSDGVGHGSEFVVRLPVITREDRPVPATTPSEISAETGGPSTAARRILVVDDSRDAAESTATLLRVQGYEVWCAGDGPTAIEVAREHRPGVILMDVGLPKQDGLAVGRQIREQPWGKDIVLIACTGWGQPEDEQRSEAAGFDYHLVKPVEPELLLRVLASVGSR